MIVARALKNRQLTCGERHAYFGDRTPKTKDLGERTGSGRNYAFSLLFAALAMAAKSSTVILPVVLCLCAWWTEGRWLWRNLVRTIPLFLMAIAASTLSIWTQVLQFAKGSDRQWARTWPGRLATAGHAVWFYLGKLLWPHPLIACYPRWQIDAGQWVSYLPLLAVIIILALLAQRPIRRRRIARLFFCVRLFRSGLAADPGINRQLYFSV
jgi:hypothetical protein